MDRPVSRRSVLAAGVGFLAAGACGKSAGRGATATTAPRITTPSPDQIEVVVASSQLLVGGPQRVTVGLVRDGNLVKQPTGVTLAFGRDFAKVGPPQPAELHDQGITERPYYRTQYTFDQPGVWVIEAAVDAKKGATQVEVITPDASPVPVAGRKMVAVDTPTVTDARGVDPICTRTPPCPFHQRTLTQALASGRPVAAIFATPALCQSRVCGPVLDILVQQAPPFAGQIEFVHVEVYKSMQTNFSEDDLTPGMKAYHLTFEPVLFLAGADGVIRERLDGPYDAAECRDALARLAKA